MNRSQKLKKLGNAVREYRGRFNSKTGKWITPPNPAAKKRVVRWLNELDLNVDASLCRIDEFKSFSEFHEWMGMVKGGDA